MIHINPYGSISEISFNGLDVTDIDQFVIEQALHVKKDNYVDIYFYVRDNAKKISFFPITDCKKVYYTILKDSEYFKEKFGDIIHDHAHFRIQYTFKFVVISIYKNDWESYVFKVEPYDSAHLADILTRDAIRQSGLHSMLYYCFSNTKPETLVKIGRIKKDFYAYKAAASYGYFKFYKGNLDNLILRLYKVCNSKNEPVYFNTTISIDKIYRVDVSYKILNDDKPWYQLFLPDDEH